MTTGGRPVQLHAYERRPGLASAPLPATYRRREPEGSVLHRVVRDGLESFLAELRDASPHGSGLPRFVERDFRGYLSCGVLAHSFSRVRCGGCGHELLVAFSCKSRGVCPSCTSRRAHDTAAHLVERVFPRVPVRQWVFTLPKQIRWHLAADPKLASAVLDLCLRVVFAWQRKRARAAGVRGGQTGAVSFAQRFGSAINSNCHFHSILADGVFFEPEGAAADAPLAFHEQRAPDDEEVEALLLKLATRVMKLLTRRGRLDGSRGDGGEPDDVLAALRAPSVASRLPPAPADADPPRRGRRSAYHEGFSLHANTHLHEQDREGLERLLVYGARGPLSLERLAELPDGRLSYRMKRKAARGSTHLVLTPVALLGKLAPVVPPPRVHSNRYHGVFAPNSAGRRSVVLAPPRRPATPRRPPSSPAGARPRRRAVLGARLELAPGVIL